MQKLQLLVRALLAAGTLTTFHATSAPPAPPWYDASTQVNAGASETIPWSHTAVRGVKARANAPIVYVVDSGVGYHNDLNVIARASPAGKNVVGCFSHSTHVAGIIGAYEGNYGVRGVFAGAPIVSVSVSTDDEPSGNCSTGRSVASMAAALQWVYEDMVARGGGPAVVNLSLNDDSGSFAPNGLIYNKIQQLITPSGSFRGAVFVQSAGNRNDEVAYQAYRTPDYRAYANDGVLVVGGLTQAGAPAFKPGTGLCQTSGGDTSQCAFLNQPYAGNDVGSNFGEGIDVWAPAVGITSTWGRFPTAPTIQQQNDPWNPSNEYAPLSGTSMAAPQVAGIAAAIYQRYAGILTLSPGDVEQMIRNGSYSLGQVDSHCNIGGGYPHVPCQVRNAVSPEDVVLDDMVERYYNTILGRPADANGRQYWLYELARVRNLGADPREIYRVMGKVYFFHWEYENRARDNWGFVHDLYQAFYQRYPDSGGYNFWVSSLSQGFNRDAEVVGFMFSPEFTLFMNSRLGNTTQRAETGLVIDAYRGFHARMVDDGGFNYWVNTLRQAQCQNSRYAVNVAANNLVWSQYGSTEYQSRNRTSAYFVADLYDVMFRRIPDLEGFNFWVGQANQHGREHVIGQFLGSPEWSARIDALYYQGCP